MYALMGECGNALKKQAMIQNIRKICFDFDGVLIDSFEQGARQTQQIAQALGLPVPSLEAIAREWGVVFADYVKELLPGATPQQFLEKHFELGFDKMHCPAVAGSCETVRNLRKKYPLSVVSNRESQSFLGLFQKAGYDTNDFIYIQTADDSDYHKPDSRVFEKMLFLAGKRGINQAEILYIGDTLVDYRSTVDTDLQFVAVLSGTGRREDFLAAGLPEEYIISSIRELPVLLA